MSDNSPKYTMFSLGIAILSLIVASLSWFYTYKEHIRNVENDKVKVESDCWLDEDGSMTVDDKNPIRLVFDMQCGIRNVGKTPAHIKSGRVEFLKDGKMTRFSGYLENPLPSRIPHSQRLVLSANSSSMEEKIDAGDFKQLSFKAAYEFVPHSDQGKALQSKIVACAAKELDYFSINKCLMESNASLIDVFNDDFGGGNGFHRYNEMAIVFRIYDGQDIYSIIDFKTEFSMSIRTREDCIKFNNGDSRFCDQETYNQTGLPSRS